MSAFKQIILSLLRRGYEGTMSDHKTEAESELAAMSACLTATERLDKEAQQRVVVWLASRLGVTIGSTTSHPKEFGDNAKKQDASGIREGTITTVSARLATKSCRELFVAAAVHLSLYQGKERFSRSDWVACAKDAKQWKVDYSVQMATTISRLLNSGFVNETAKDIFSVPDDQLRQFEARINS